MNRLITFLVALFTYLISLTSHADLSGFGFKIYHVNSALYPYVQVYMRTFDEEFLPVESINELQVAVMDRGHVYDPQKRQYFIESIRNRREAARFVIVLDNSKSMAGDAFENALKGTARVIDSKRPQDQVAVLALTDESIGYKLVSNFEKDPEALIRRLRDVTLDNDSTRLYDALSASLQLCSASEQGGQGIVAEFPIVSCSVMIFSDGKNENSAITRADLMTRISNLSVPIPIYSFSSSSKEKLESLNLQALSINSFGKFYDAEQASVRLTASVDEVMDIVQSDYILTFRAYSPVNGQKYPFKIGIEYPSKSGKFRTDNAHYEAIRFPNIGNVNQAKKELAENLKPLEDSNPYLD